MNDRLSDVAETPKEHRIGIRVKLRCTTDAVELQPHELERLRAQEAHLRAALARAGLTLTPLGYIEGVCVQYTAQLTTDSAARPEDEEVPIHRRLERLIEEARAARSRLVASTESAGQPSGADASETTAPEANEATILTSVTDDAVGGNAAPTVDASESAASTAAPLHDGDDEALVRNVQHGPDIITVDGRPIQWSSAIMPVDAPAFGSPKTIECTLGQPERHFVDRRGRRYCVPDSCNADQLIEGTRVRVDHIRVEQVFTTTIRHQRDLEFDTETHPT